MELGLGVLRMAPREFWRMTPRELEAALRGAGLLGQDGSALPSRLDLATLMAAFPDP